MDEIFSKKKSFEISISISYRYGVYALNFHQNFSNFYLVKAVRFQLSPKIFGKVWGAKRSHPFFSHRILAKKICSQKLSPKENQKVLMKIEEMVDVFLNLDNFVKHTLSPLAPPSGYALNIDQGDKS